MLSVLARAASVRWEEAMFRLLATAAILAFGLAAAPLQAAEPLVDVEWIKAQGQTPGVVVLDIRNKLGQASEADYLAGHIPGAIYSDYLKDGWRTKVAGIPGQLPTVADLERLIGGLGIGNDDHVVIVAGGVSALDMGSATRVYWTFKVLGHDAVSILDGGHQAYASDPANPLETAVGTRRAKTFKAEFRPEMIADRQDVADAMAKGTPLIDLRPPRQYRGAAAHPAASWPGTIPGAVNLPEGLLTERGGHLVGAGRVGELLAGLGLEGEGEQISFCNTGHWASLGWFAASEIGGNKAVKLYDGSMVDWTSVQSLPVELQEQ